MILLIHHRAQKVIKVIDGNNNVDIRNSSCTSVLWEMAEKYPERIISWCEVTFQEDINLDNWNTVFKHDLILASFAVKTTFMPKSIGYIDQLPFVNVNPKVKYATWLMSSDIGGINGRVLLNYRKMFGHIKDFNFLLNSISKLGQQNGLFSYSAPLLVNQTLRSLSNQGIKSLASTEDLFSFVYSHYKGIRLWLLFWCFMKYERSFPLLAFGRALFQKKYFKKDIELVGISNKLLKAGTDRITVDVIIPTLGRRDYLLQVLKDLKEQTLLPEKVIVVEQNPEIDSQSEVPELAMGQWPFKIVHHFTHKTGACNARNIALEEIDADLVFFADDDIRFNSNLLQNCVTEIQRIGVDCLNMNCKQQGEETVFHKVKQWGSFASGTSIVNSNYCKELRFNKIFEYGFGEDKDFGMQLRNAGCDIIYHPNLEVLHLKAPRGGFREKIEIPWENDSPKPSPTLMVFAKKYYNQEQLRGFKTELFLRYFQKQKIKNPVKYHKMMQKRWKLSENWAKKLINAHEEKLVNEI